MVLFIYRVYYVLVYCGSVNDHLGPSANLFLINSLTYSFLADRTNGRAYATVLRLSVCSLSSVCRLSVTLCIVAKRCVLEQKLLLKAYRKSYMRNQLIPK